MSVPQEIGQAVRLSDSGPCATVNEPHTAGVAPGRPAQAAITAPAPRASRGRATNARGSMSPPVRRAAKRARRGRSAESAMGRLGQRSGEGSQSRATPSKHCSAITQARVRAGSSGVRHLALVRRQRLSKMSAATVTTPKVMIAPMPTHGTGSPCRIERSAEPNAPIRSTRKHAERTRIVASVGSIAAESPASSASSATPPGQ